MERIFQVMKVLMTSTDSFHCVAIPVCTPTTKTGLGIKESVGPLSVCFN